MLDFYYNQFKVKAQNLNRIALTQLKYISAFALIGLPVLTYLAIIELPKNVEKFLLAPLVILVFLSLVIVATNRLGITLQRTDKNLDEWEVALKRKAESFSFRFILLIGALLLGYFVYLSHIAHNDFGPVTFQLQHIFYVFMCFFMTILNLPVTYAAWTQRPLDEDTNTINNTN